MRQQEASGSWRGPWRTCEAVGLATLQWERRLRAPARACPAWLPASTDACRVFSVHHPYRDAPPALFPAMPLPDDAASGRCLSPGRIESGGNPAAEPPSCPTAPGNLPTTQPPAPGSGCSSPASSISSVPRSGSRRSGCWRTRDASWTCPPCRPAAASRRTTAAIPESTENRTFSSMNFLRCRLLGERGLKEPGR